MLSELPLASRRRQNTISQRYFLVSQCLHMWPEEMPWADPVLSTSRDFSGFSQPVTSGAFFRAGGINRNGEQHAEIPQRVEN